MKIEIDLNDILGDEHGSETLQESIKRQTIEKLKDEIKTKIDQQINEEVSIFINKTLNEAVKGITPKLTEQLMDAEYTPIDKWGSMTKGKTTFRKELLRTIQEQMIYKKTDYSREKNTFTGAVDDALKEYVFKFQKQFNNTVDSMYIKETMDFATETLRKKLNIKV